MKGNTYTVMRKINNRKLIHFDFWNHAREIGIDINVPITQCLFAQGINYGDELTETQMITLLMSLILFKMTGGTSNENASGGAYMKYMEGGEMK